MAQYRNSFNSYSGTLNDWTERGTTGHTFEFISDSSVIDGVYLKVTAPSTGTNFAITWDPVGQPINSQIAVRFRIPSGGAVTDLPYVIGRFTAIGLSETGYLTNRSTSQSTILKRVANVNTVLNTGTSTPLATDTWYWVLMDIEGNFIQYKTWTGSFNDQPDNFSLAALDGSIINPGYLGLKGKSNSSIYHIDFFSVGTNGDAAPGPANIAPVLVSSSTILNPYDTANSIAVATTEEHPTFETQALNGSATLLNPYDIANSIVATATAENPVIIPTITPISITVTALNPLIVPIAPAIPITITELAPFPPLYTQHPASYGNEEISVAHVSWYGTIVEKQKYSFYSNSSILAKQLRSSYQLNVIVAKSKATLYSTAPVIVKQNSISYSGSTLLEKQKPASYSDVPLVAKQHHVNYSRATLLAKQNSISYSNSAIVLVQKPASYSDVPLVAKQHSALYSAASILAKQNSISYSNSAIVLVQKPASYSDVPLVAKQHSALYSEAALLRKQAPTSYSTSPLVALQHSSYYQNSDILSKQHSTSYSNSAILYLQKADIYSLNTVLIKSKTHTYSNTSSVTTQKQSSYALLSVTPVTKSRSFYYALLASDSYNYPATVTVTLNATTVTIDSECLISKDEADVAWTCRFKVSSYDDFLLFKEGDVFVIDFLGEEYTFQYSSKNFTRSAPGEFIGTIEGASPVIDLTSPRSTTIDFTFEEPTLLSEIIETILGETVEWNTLDWTISGFKVAAEKALPLDFAKDTLYSLGIILESKKDGTLRARNKYPVSIIDYESVAADHIYTDVEDIISAQQQYELREGYNKYRVTNQDVGINDRLEAIEDEDDPLMYTLRAYPAPWRTNFVIRHTSLDLAIYLAEEGWITREETELVEFTEGVANLRYPAEALLSVTWKSTILGGINFTPYSEELTVPITINEGYGLAEITYRVKYLEYVTSSPYKNDVQYLLEEL